MSVLNSDLLARLDASTRDVSNAVTLPAEIYTSGEFLSFETEALYMKEWLCVGRAERIANVGDWFTVDLVDESLIISSPATNRIPFGPCRRCANTVQCRYVKARATARPSNCPYHHWNYALDGRLLGASAMERTEAFNNPNAGCPN